MSAVFNVLLSLLLLFFYYYCCCFVVVVVVVGDSQVLTVKLLRFSLLLRCQHKTVDGGRRSMLMGWKKGLSAVWQLAAATFFRWFCRAVNSQLIQCLKFAGIGSKFV